MTLRLSSPRGAPYLRVRVQAPGSITAAELNEQSLHVSAYTWARDGLLQFNYASVPERGITLSLAVDAPGMLRVHIADNTLGFPDSLAASQPERPEGTMPSPLFPRDATTVSMRYSL